MIKIAISKCFVCEHDMEYVVSEVVRNNKVFKHVNSFCPNRHNHASREVFAQKKPQEFWTLSEMRALLEGAEQFETWARVAKHIESTTSKVRTAKACVAKWEKISKGNWSTIPSTPQEVVSTVLKAYHEDDRDWRYSTAKWIP